MARIKLSAGLPDDYYGFKCPGCNGYHEIPTKGPKAWGFNGNLNSPTFTPSILVRWYKNGDVPGELKNVCHSFVTAGRIQFLSDCTHKLAGQTVELSEIESAPAPESKEKSK